MKKAFAALGIILGVALLVCFSIFASIYTTFQLNFAPTEMPIFDENKKPIEDTSVEVTPFFPLTSDITYNNQEALAKLIDEKQAEFLARYGKGTHIRCDVLEKSHWTLKIAYTGTGTVKETGEVEDINLLCKYKIYSYMFKPTVTYSQYREVAS